MKSNVQTSSARLGFFGGIAASVLLWTTSIAIAADVSNSTRDARTRAEALESGRHFVEAEPLRRQILAIDENRHPDSHEIAVDLTGLGLNLESQGRYSDAEPVFRRALSIDERIAPQSADVARDQRNIGSNLIDQRLYVDAEKAFRAAGEIDAATPSRIADRIVDLHQIAVALAGQNRLLDAETVYRQILSIDQIRKPVGTDSAAALMDLADNLDAQNRFSEAADTRAKAVAIDMKIVPAGRDTAYALLKRGFDLESAGDCAAAEDLDRQALAIDQRAQRRSFVDEDMVAVGSSLSCQAKYGEAESLFASAFDIAYDIKSPDDIVNALRWSGLNLAYLGKNADAENALKAVLAIDQKQDGPDVAEIGIDLSNIGLVLDREKRFADAESVFRDALKIRAPMSSIGQTFSNLGSVMLEQHHYGDAENFARQALLAHEKSVGAKDLNTLSDFALVADALRKESNFTESIAAYVSACNGLMSFARRPGKLGLDVGTNEGADCNRGLALSLWGAMSHSVDTLSLYSNGAAPMISGFDPADLSDAKLGFTAGLTGRPDEKSTPSIAFIAAQLGEQSAAADALARKAALTAIAAADKRGIALKYEHALADRETLEKEFTSAVSDSSEVAHTRAQRLSDGIQQTDRLIASLTDELTHTVSRYWDYRSPSPVSVDALQAPTAAGLPELLHDDEVLIFWMFAPDDDKGLVFAVSKEKFAWAEMGLTGADLTGGIENLRKEIDPQGFGTRSADTDNERAARPSFDRQTAYALYQALLGDKAIQAVVADKPTLLIVPTGPLTSLPPSLLVVSPPEGGPAMDSDPKALRDTHWLIKDKAIAILPAVSSLHMLRQLSVNDRQHATEPLLELADPDFKGDGAVPPPDAGSGHRSGPLRAQDAEIDGRTKADVLASLPPLGGTLREGQLLKASLGAPDDSLLLGPKASKTELDMRQNSGRLAKVDVLGFATHGLVSGDFTGLTEPALALAHPGPGHDAGDDGLLKASDAATLTLNADWVVLSACNTASPDAPESQGLSGLARAFFYAGAKSLLVSHWRVRDDAAERLVTETFRLQRGGRPTFRRESPYAGLNENPPAMTKAQALRIATLELLDDTSGDDPSDAAASLANPSAWAPFVVVGEAR